MKKTTGNTMDAKRPVDRIVMLRCSKRGCPRIKKIHFDYDTMPPNTAAIESLCSWHDNGDFQEEMYFDSEGVQINVDGERLTQ